MPARTQQFIGGKIALSHAVDPIAAKGGGQGRARHLQRIGKPLKPLTELARTIGT